MNTTRNNLFVKRLIIFLIMICTAYLSACQSENSPPRQHSSLHIDSTTASDTDSSITSEDNAKAESDNSESDEYYNHGTIYDVNMQPIISSEINSSDEPYRKMGVRYTALSNIICDQSCGLDSVFSSILREKNPTKVNIDDSIGCSVQLTLNADMTRKIYDRLNNEGITGSVVVLRDDGSVASMVSCPTYDANKLHDDPGYEATLTKKGTFTNRTLQQAAPGSTFKIISEVVADINGIDTAIDEGMMLVDGVPLKNWDWGINPDYPVTTNREDSFIRSSNLFFAKVFAYAGTKNVTRILADYFMFGDNIVIECDFGTLSNSLSISTKDDLYRSGFGQAKVRTTPMYLAALTRQGVYGTFLKPYILKNKIDTKTKEVIENTEQKTELSAIPVKYREGIRKCMKSAGQCLNGINVPDGYSFYAKTGTADITDTSSFLYITGGLVSNNSDHGFIVTMQIQNPEELGIQYASGSVYIYNDILKIICGEESF